MKTVYQSQWYTTGPRRAAVFVLCLSAIWTVGALAARADLIYGTGGTPFGSGVPAGFTTPPVADTGAQSYDITSDPTQPNTGTVETKVWRNGSGVLAFEYITTPSGTTNPPDHVGKLTIAPPASDIWPGDVITAVNVVSGPNPFQVFLNLAARELNIQFDAANELHQPSDIWVVTSATNYDRAQENVIDGSIDHKNSFAPAPVPEPKVLIGLLGVGAMIWLGLVCSYRRSAAA